jgi:hypothetical protein
MEVNNILSTVLFDMNVKTLKMEAAGTSEMLATFY